MVRIGVGLLHVFMAIALILNAIPLGMQASVNMAWESGFYHQISDGTKIMAAASVIGAVMGLADGIVGIAFMLRWSWGPSAMFFGSLSLMFLVPPPISYLMAFSATVGFVHRRRRMLTPPEP